MIIETLSRVEPNTRLFLAEGQSEAGFIEAVLKSKNVSDKSLVYCFKGIKNFPLVLKSISGVPGLNKLSSLGVMLDADHSYASRLTSITDVLKNEGVTVSQDDIRQSRVFTHESCQLGIYISPGANKSGCIEDVALIEIQSSIVWPCVDAYTKCIEKTFGQSLSQKSLVQTYISSKQGNICGLGRAFQASLLDIQHPAYEVARTLVENLT